MLTWNEWVSLVLMVIGCGFTLTGALGIIRLPDFYTRLHAAGLVDTVGQAFILLGCAFQLPGHATNPVQTGARLFFIFLCLLITSPTSTHAISKAAFISGLQPVLGVDLEKEKTSALASASSCRAKREVVEEAKEPSDA